jgi:hypothetical protein
MVLTPQHGDASTFGRDPPVSTCPEAIAIVGMGEQYEPAVLSQTNKLSFKAAAGREEFQAPPNYGIY